ncbi:MAG TPA: hypothetical protein VF334_10095 [Polyangia bacterium]
MHHAAVESSTAASELDLDSLARRSYAALETLYRAAPTPRSMHAVDGAPKGRMLAVRFIDGAPVAALLRAFAASPAFVWDGKTFHADSDDEGAGINRIRIPGALGRQDLFPFHTRFGASAVDGAPALILDYDLPKNPPWIRKVHDEIREVAPGLFLGPAMWRSASGPRTVLWFALDTRVAGEW